MNRSYSLWSMGIAVLREGDPDRAARLMREGLRLTRIIDEPLTASAPRVAGLDLRQPQRPPCSRTDGRCPGHAVGSSPILFHNHSPHHETCVRMVRRSLSAGAFLAAQREGAALTFAETVAY